MAEIAGLAALAALAAPFGLSERQVILGLGIVWALYMLALGIGAVAERWGRESRAEEQRARERAEEEERERWEFPRRYRGGRRDY